MLIEGGLVAEVSFEKPDLANLEARGNRGHA